MNTALTQLLDRAKVKAYDDITSFQDYLALIRSEPWVTRNSMQLLHDMMLAQGVEYSILPGKPVRHRYSFFLDANLVGPFVVFGQQRAKENLVEKIDNASRGLEAAKRLWILLGAELALRGVP